MNWLNKLLRVWFIPILPVLSFILSYLIFMDFFHSICTYFREGSLLWFPSQIFLVKFKKHITFLFWTSLQIWKPGLVHWEFSNLAFKLVWIHFGVNLNPVLRKHLKLQTWQSLQNDLKHMLSKNNQVKLKLFFNIIQNKDYSHAHKPTQKKTESHTCLKAKEDPSVTDNQLGYLVK